MEFGILSLIILVADIYALYHVITSSASILSKVLWVLAILILPVIGFIIWLIAGPRSNGAPA